VRNYDPQTGRFLQPDPFKGYLSEPASQNPYMYCRGNPVKYSDPSGYDGMTREELESLGDSGWRSLEITAAGVSALSDGPLPIGDAGAAVMLVDALMLKSFLLKKGVGLPAHILCNHT